MWCLFSVLTSSDVCMWCLCSVLTSNDVCMWSLCSILTSNDVCMWSLYAVLTSSDVCMRSLCSVLTSSDVCVQCLCSVLTSNDVVLVCSFDFQWCMHSVFVFWLPIMYVCGVRVQFCHDAQHLQTDLDHFLEWLDTQPLRAPVKTKDPATMATHVRVS